MINPFKPWILSPTIHICVHSALAIPLIIFMTTQEQGNLGSKWILDWFSCRMQDLPSTWTESEQWDITYHQCACFPEDPSAKCLSEGIRVAYKYH